MAIVHNTLASLLLVLVAAQLPSPTVAAHVASSSTSTSCIPHEREALLAFKRGIIRDPWGNLALWQRGGEDCCKWNGVVCSNHTGHVLKLQLGSCSLVGQISHSLLSLEHLEHLDLSGNSLNGSSAGRIPEFLGSMNSLKYLDLSKVPFSGRVPSQLGNLSNLQYLHLSSSTQDSLLRSTDLSWLTHLHFLQYLRLYGVNLSAVGDWALAVNMIPSLKVLELCYCSLTNAEQSLPRLNLTNLEKLDLSGNLLGHPIASCWFWNITHLKHLDLESTDLYGPLPLALGGMKYLEDLRISSSISSFLNKCIFITSLRNLCSLETLCIRYTLCGEITEILESLPRCSPNRLQELNLESNNISGTLPNQMWPLTSLESLDLYGNNIGGTLPNWMGQLTSLGYLDLSQNNISGMLPDSLRMLTGLGYLALTYNNITGPLPSFVGEFTGLSYLDLSYNRLTGQVPREIGMLRNLENLDLTSNNLDGTITEEHFASLKSLWWLDLSYNSLKIEISSEWQPPFRLQQADFASCRMGPAFPSWLKLMVDINWLDISNTGINDRLPHWFCSTFSKARYLNISNNQIGGGLPANMEHMSVERLLIGSNQLTGPIPPMPISLTTLDLSGNLLSGPLQ